MKHKILLFGHGIISKAYIKAIKTINDMEIVAVLGQNQKRVQEYASEHSIPYHGTDFNELVNAAHPSMVIICTPNAVHYQNVIDSAHRGLHILCEKPLHISINKQNEMIELCKKNAVKLGVCFGRRFLNHMKYVKDMIESETLGKILVIDAFIKLWRDSTYYTESSWRGSFEIDGGGPFIQQGSHIIDLALWFGSGYQEVMASRLFTLYHPIPVEDHGYAVIKYANDAVGIIEASTICKGQRSNRIEISGTKGTIHLDFNGILLWDVEDHEKPDFPSNNNVCYLQLMDFKQAVENDTQPYITGESAKQAVELITDIYQKNIKN